MTTRTLSTTRPTTDVAPVSGLASPFPILLGGTEPLRTLRRTAEVVVAEGVDRPTRDPTTVTP